MSPKVYLSKLAYHCWINRKKIELNMEKLLFIKKQTQQNINNLRVWAILCQFWPVSINLAKSLFIETGQFLQNWRKKFQLKIKKLLFITSSMHYNLDIILFQIISGQFRPVSINKPTRFKIPNLSKEFLSVLIPSFRCRILSNSHACEQELSTWCSYSSFNWYINVSSILLYDLRNLKVTSLFQDTE